MSTERMDDNQGTARMDGNKGGAATTAAVVFSSGQIVVLNGKDCVIDSMISMGSGEAVVYKVTIDGKPYALKHYKPDMPLSDTAKKVIARIKDNPRDRVVKIYDFGKYNGQDFEVMEYAEGGTLEQYLKSSGAVRDATKIKNIVKMITEGLEQLHGYYKVIYQDLKPENIYFKDAGKTSLVLADFGISSIMAGYDEEVEVTASITDLYAAPELARKGNRNEVMATPAVDYFALGITMFELWLGEKPFKGIKATMRDYMIAEEKVDFPIDMPDDYATIIKGLIRPQRKDRWGKEQVRKWLKDEALAEDSHISQKASTHYDPLKFSNTESAASPKELAALMEKYPDIGKTCLYDGIIKDWLKKAGDLMLYNEIQNITSRYTSDKEAGLYTAILSLDPERPFRSRGGKICRTTEDIADAIMAESAYYMEELKKPSANLYLYLAATEGSQGKEAADSFCKYFKEYTPKRALALVYFKLQSDGGITIGAKHYQSPEELKREKDSGQIALVKKAVTEKDSMLLVWLSDIYGDKFKSTDTFGNLSIPEQFFLLGLLPFLSFREYSYACWDALRYLIESCPGRADLLEIYAAQGLPLTGRNLDGRSVIGYVVFRFNELSKKHGADTIRNMIRLLCKLGADVNEYSGDGTNPLINAYNAKKNDVAILLLELGADENRYSEYIYNQLVQDKGRATTEEEYRDLAVKFLGMNGYKDTKALADDCENQIRVIKERRAEEERVLRENSARLERAEREYKAEKERKRRQEDEDRKRREAKAERNRKLRIFTGVFAVVLVVAAIILFIVYRLTGSFFKFQQNDQGTITVTGYSGRKEVVIPADANGVSVTVIGNNAFSGKKLTGVSIPDSVTVIEDNAFRNNLLTSIAIPDSVTTIGNHAFIDNKLTELTIGSSVTTIGDFAFAGSADNTDNATWDGNQLTSVIIPDSVTRIGHRAFRINKLTSVTIGNNVEFIGNRAFSANKLTSVTIPNSVTYIDEAAFIYNQLTDIVIPDNVTNIEASAFYNNQLTSVVIGKKVAAIGDSAFEKNSISNISFPNSVTSIGISAFSENPVTSVRIGSNVKLGDTGQLGILGAGTGFNSAYANNGRRAGTYTRPNKDSGTWTRR